MTKHIFISYSHNDVDIMQHIKETVAKSEIEVWTDEGVEPDTPNWYMRVEDAILSSYCLICVLTPNTRTSEWVREELSFAKLQKKSIYMVLANGSIESSAMFGFSSSQVTDATDNSNYDIRMANLLNYIRLKHITGEGLKETNPFTNDVRDVVEKLSHEYDNTKSPIPQHEIHRIVVYKGSQFTGLSTYDIHKGHTTFGRADDNDIVVYHDGISRYHFELQYTPQGMLIKDTKSTNGIKVNGSKEKSVILKDGDRIEIGSQIQFRYYTSRIS